MSDLYDVLVIGSGIGGLTSAALLAKRGMRVLVLEQSHRIGGCCSAYEKNGYTFDVGAVFILAREIYERLFELLGLRLEDHLEMRLLDPVYDIFFDNGNRVLIHYDVEKTVEELKAINPREAERYRDFCRDMSAIWAGSRAAAEVSFKSVEEVSDPLALARRVLNPTFLRNLPMTLKTALGSQQKTIDRYFSDSNMKAVVGFENLYAGLPANRINGLFTLLSYVCHEGYYYPKGGMVAIPRALASILGSFGGELRTGVRVEKILAKDGRAYGVRTAGGEEIAARIVLSNVSCIPTYLDLVGEEHLSKAFVRALKGYRVSIPAPIVYFGLRERPPFRCHSAVMVGGLEKINAYWDEYYAHGLMARIDDLPVGLTFPSLGDDTMAPPGRYAVSALLPSPYRLKYSTWDREKPYLIEEVITSIERRAFPGFGSMVEFAEMTTPLDFERELNLPEGAIYGLEMSVPHLGPFRASYRSPVLGNLYLAGASTNPGGGVPLVMMSGMFATSLILKDMARR